jgi:hypothetical protein
MTKAVAKAKKQSKNKMGRPTAWRDEFLSYGYRLALLGATNPKIADAFGVSIKTLEAWQRSKPDFKAVLARGRAEADANVAHSLYRKATGYKKTVEKSTASGKVVTLREFFPPDTTAAIFWLKNRARDDWKDRHDVDATHTHTISEAFETFVREISTGSRKAPEAPAIDHQASELEPTE